MIEQQEALRILEKRRVHLINDNFELQEKRKKFLDWLVINYYLDDLFTFEMYMFDVTRKTDPVKYQNFNPMHNTRTKTSCETCLEIDKLDFEKRIKIILEVIKSLIINNVHFAVFYAEGQRSPHIRIYDFDELQDLNPQQKIKVQIEFWRRHVPFGLFQYCDTGIFMEGHPLQLEFAPHWKYGTVFDLLFEYVPNLNKNNLNND